MQYRKDLTHLTTFRLSRDLRDKAELCAEYQGLTFSAFLRQSLYRNIDSMNNVGVDALIQNSNALCNSHPS